VLEISYWALDWLVGWGVNCNFAKSNSAPIFVKTLRLFLPHTHLQIIKNIASMNKLPDIKIFEEKKVRTLWDAEQEKWYLSIVDVIAVLTDSPNPRKYWSVLKTKLKAEGSQLATNCSQLKMQSADGKYYLTDV
jgi:hypothetical protein